MILKIIISICVIGVGIYLLFKDKNSRQKVIDDYFEEKNILDVKKYSVSTLNEKIKEFIGVPVILYLSTSDISATGIVKDMTGEFIQIENQETKELVSINCIDIDYIEINATLPTKKIEDNIEENKGNEKIDKIIIEEDKTIDEKSEIKDK